MFILSDIQTLPKKFLGNNLNKLPETIELSSAIMAIQDQIFSKQKIYSFKSKDIEYWQYLFLTENANSSQFDLLLKLNNKGIDFPDGIVCIAEKGRGFHGFRNRVWDAKKGNLHLSISFKPEETFNYFPAALLMLSAVSIIETLDEISELNSKASSKWVNDIVIDNYKVGGIITQTSSTGNKIANAFIGIGLNVLTQPEIIPDIFTPKAACLRKFVEIPSYDLVSILISLLNNLAQNIRMLNSQDSKIIYKKYCERSAVIGKQVEIYSDPLGGNSKLISRGKVVGISENLELILKDSSEPVRSGRLKLLD